MSLHPVALGKVHWVYKTTHQYRVGNHSFGFSPILIDITDYQRQLFIKFRFLFAFVVPEAGESMKKAPAYEKKNSMAQVGEKICMCRDKV